MEHLADLRHIPFMLYQVLNILGLKNNGNNHRQVGNSILRINKTLMDAIGTFCSEGKKAYARAVFITTARVGGSRSGRRSRGCLLV